MRKQRSQQEGSSVIVEPTSGNAESDWQQQQTVKRLSHDPYYAGTMSVERRNIVKAYGAEVVLTDGTKGMKGAIEKADELAKRDSNSASQDGL